MVVFSVYRALSCLLCSPLSARCKPEGVFGSTEKFRTAETLSVSAQVVRVVCGLWDLQTAGNSELKVVQGILGMIDTEV